MGKAKAYIEKNDFWHIFILVFLGLLLVTFNIQPVKASSTIYIRADGSIDPPTANITTIDNITYTFTGHINHSQVSLENSLIVEKGDIIIDGLGYTLQGSYFQTHGIKIGINVWHRRNVTIKNLRISGFLIGIYLNESSNSNIHQNNITANIWGSFVQKSSWNNSISRNNITDNWSGITLRYTFNNTIRRNNIIDNSVGIRLQSASNNTVSGNHVARNMYEGVWLNNSYNNILCRNYIADNSKSFPALGGFSLRNSSYNFIFGNNITANGNDGIRIGNHSDYNRISGNNITNNDDGILLDHSSNNTVLGNEVKNNDGGIFFWYSSDNRFYHNNFINNTAQAHSLFSTNIWDNGCEGNYWNNYNGTDSDGDGLGDIPYIIDENNTDWYPLMNPYWSPCDINHDSKVDIADVNSTAAAFGSKPSSKNWNCQADITGPTHLKPDNKVDMRDIALVARHFGETDP